MATLFSFSGFVAACALAVSGHCIAQSSAVKASADALSLAHATELLLRDSPAIRMARRATEIAASETRRVDVAPNPTLSAQVSNTIARQYRWPESDRLLRIERLFERGGKRELRVGFARAAQQAAQLELADVVRRQRADLARAYFDLAAAQALLGIAEDNAADQARLEAAAERRLKAGDVSAVEVSRLRVESSRLANEVRAAQAAVDEARIRLAALLGAPERAAGLVATDPLPELPADGAPTDPPLPIPPQRIDAATIGRADAAAAAVRAQALVTAVRLAESLRTRDLTLGAQAERAPSFGGSVFGLSVSVPLLVGNDYTGEILRARAEQAQADEDLLRVRAAVRADIDLNASQLAAARDRAGRLAAVALPEARRAAEGMAFAYARGAAGLTDLLDARRQFAAVLSEAVIARSEFARALAGCRASLVLEESP